MKRITGGVLFLLFLIVVILPFIYSQKSGHYHYVQFDTVRELQEYLRYTPGKPPLIGAHRGGPTPGFPENALETFRNSLKYAPCLIECDVRLTKDGELILIHDSNLERTTTGQGPVRDYTLSELKQFRLKDNAGKLTEYRIPTLAEALQWAVGKAILELDIKQGVKPKAVLDEIIDNKALSHVVVITYNLDQLQVYRNLHPELMISASAHTIDGVERILDTGIKPERLLVFVGVTEPALDVYAMLHANGIRAILGTMHNIDQAAQKRGTKIYRRVLGNGADILATDNLPLTSRAIQEFLKEKKGSNLIKEGTK